MIKIKHVAEIQPTNSVKNPMDQIAAMEDELMRTATEFGRAWGCDQTAHPKMYWLDLHIERLRKLCAAAISYAEAVSNR